MVREALCNVRPQGRTGTDWGALHMSGRILIGELSLHFTFTYNISLFTSGTYLGIFKRSEHFRTLYSFERYHDLKKKLFFVLMLN